MTKAWSYSVMAEFRKFVKGLVALALCLGTIGAALAFVNVGTAAAAGTPTITAISPVSGLPGRWEQGDDHRDEFLHDGGRRHRRFRRRESGDCKRRHRGKNHH